MKSPMEAKRIEISALLRAGHKQTDIAKQLNVNRMIVYRVSQRLNNSETLKDRPRSGRPQKIRRETIKKAFENDPELKMTRLAQKKKISVSTVSRVVKSMGGKSLRRFKKPLLSAAMIQKRLDRSTRLLNDLKSHGNRILIFSDEKTFTVDPVFNRQNDRVVSFGNDVSNHQRVSTTKHPASVMMLGVVASNGEKMPPVWFERGYRLTSAVYKEILETKVLPWVKRITKKADYVFQQDGAPAHTAKIAQNWLETNMSFWPKDFWPPQSPDLNPLDFSVWAHIEARACKTRHSNTDELKASVNRAWAYMKKNFVRKACKSFRPRLERVIAAKGGHFE